MIITLVIIYMREYGSTRAKLMDLQIIYLKLICCVKSHNNGMSSEDIHDNIYFNRISDTIQKQSVAINSGVMFRKSYFFIYFRRRSL